MVKHTRADRRVNGLLLRCSTSGGVTSSRSDIFTKAPAVPLAGKPLRALSRVTACDIIRLWVCKLSRGRPYLVSKKYNIGLYDVNRTSEGNRDGAGNERKKSEGEFNHDDNV